MNSNRLWIEFPFKKKHCFNLTTLINKQDNHNEKQNSQSIWFCSIGLVLHVLNCNVKVLKCYVKWIQFFQPFLSFISQFLFQCNQTIGFIVTFHSVEFIQTKKYFDILLHGLVIINWYPQNYCWYDIIK